MGRILAIDYGTKRTGIAVTDILRIVPGGLCTVPTHELLTWLDGYFRKEDVTTVVVGYAKNMDNRDSASMEHIRPFVEKFKARWPEKEVVMQDERFTSVLAQRAILESGMGRMARRNNKGLVDEVSATIILQSYMDTLDRKL